MQVRKASIGFDFRKCLLICLLVIIGIGKGVYASAGDTENEMWNKANQFYTQKKYDSAVANYELLLKTNNSNAMLHYNIGNAYYRMNKMGLAILHYEKAAHSNSGNKEIHTNLQLAKSRVQDNMTESNPIFFVTWWNALNHTVSANVWAVLALLMFLTVLVLIYFARTKKEHFANSGRWVSLGIVCLLITGSMTWISYDEYAHPNKAVVINTGGVFLQSPQANGKIIGNLPEGLVIEILDHKGDFYKVELQNGKSGWIAADALGIV